jgi:hypothetical protein
MDNYDPTLSEYKKGAEKTLFFRTFVRIGNEIFGVTLTSHKMIKETDGNKSVLYEGGVNLKGKKIATPTYLGDNGGSSISVSQSGKNVKPTSLVNVFKFVAKAIRNVFHQEKSPQQEIADKQAVIAKYPTAKAQLNRVGELLKSIDPAGENYEGELTELSYLAEQLVGSGVFDIRALGIFEQQMGHSNVNDN